MDPLVFAAVLCAAACHAGWNAAVKLGLDPFPNMILITSGAAVIALVLIPFVGVPDAAAWPYIAASAVVHTAYFAALVESYRVGDMGQVYPIARGSAPLLTAIATTLIVGEQTGLIAWLGIVMLASGVLLLSMRGGRDLARIDKRSVGFALLTAVTICGYSLVDGVGARVSGNAHAYSAWMFVGNGIGVLVYAAARRQSIGLTTIARYWRPGLGGGALQLVSYGIAIWAMTVAPIAIVAALRETSVLFGAAIAVVWLKEPLRPTRLVAALIIVTGLVLIRLS